jgi:hypothetical protein
VDGEGVEGLFPAVAAGAEVAAAFGVDVAQGEVEKFDRGVVVGEVAAVLDLGRAASAVRLG